MEKQKIFVFRISKGNAPGNPIGNCPLDYSDILKTIENLSSNEIKPIDYSSNGYLNYIFKELWHNNTLRQGWGLKNLDLNQEPKSWIGNYMLSGKIYWNEDVDCNQAKGRHNILKRIPLIKKNDVILIPKTSSVKLNDFNKFVGCQVDVEYYFDYPKGLQDFGHCLKVKNIKEFRYNESNLERSDFGTPYLWAVTEVKSHHSRYSRLIDFVEREFS